MPYSYDDIGEIFFCDVLEPAKTTCSHHQNITSQYDNVQKSIPSKRIDNYQLMATFLHYEMDNGSKRIKNSTHATVVTANGGEEWLSSSNESKPTIHELPWELRKMWKESDDHGIWAPGDVEKLGLILPFNINKTALLNNSKV
jgi:hypothetical protein